MWWNDIKMILCALAFFIVPYIIVLLIMAAPELTPIIIVSVILLGILIKALVNVISKLINNIDYSIRQAKYTGEEKDIVNKMKQKWVNDLRNGKPVLMGNVMIQCKNNFFSINGKHFYIKEIQGIDITCKILYVLEEIINMHIKPYIGFVHDENSVEPDGSASRSSSYDDSGKVISTRTLSEEEYHNIIKNRYNQNQYTNSEKSYIYKFEKEYYIKINFYNGKNELCPIGREADTDNRCIIPREAEERLIEIERYIRELKMNN